MSKEFLNKMETVMDALGFKLWQRNIVDSWYSIEDEDDDMSTEYLLARVCDDTGKDEDEILSVMGEFSEKYDELYGAENA